MQLERAAFISDLIHPHGKKFGAVISGEIFFFKFYIASYNLLNINRVISKVVVRKGREAGTIHGWFTGALLLGCLPAITV